MSIASTFVALVLVCLIIAVAFWRDGLPRSNGKVHWFSWKPILMIGVVIFIVLLTHLVNSYGIETGRDRGLI